MPFRIGVVGYSAAKFDSAAAREHIRHAFDWLEFMNPNALKIVVSGLTDIGVPAIAYKEASSRHWGTLGIACGKAHGLRWYDVDSYIIAGREWGDESETFLNSIDALVRVGGDEQSAREVGLCKRMGKPVLEYELVADS